MVVSAGGAAMLVPAAYSLVKAPKEAWIFWVPSVIVLALGAVLYYLTRRQPRRYVSRQSMFLMVVVCWGGRGARWYPAFHTLWPLGSGGRLLQLHGRFHDHRGRNGHAGRAPACVAALAQPESMDRGDRYHRAVCGHRAA